MKSFALIILFPLSLFLVGCSEPQAESESWYDQTRKHSERRQEYVDAQVEMGVSEVDAKREFDAQYWIGRAGPFTRRPVERSGDDLREILEEE